MPDYTTHYSIPYPIAGDRIKDANSDAKLADDIRQTAMVTDSALITVLQDARETVNTAIDELKPMVLDSGTWDINTLTERRGYLIRDSATVQNAPRPGTHALLRVDWYTSSDIGLVQTWEDVQNDYAIFRRRSFNGGASWTTWRILVAESETVSSTTADLNDMTEPRVRILRNSSTLINAPRTGVNAFLRVEWTLSSGLGIVQTWEDVQSDYAIFRRRSLNRGASWTDWERLNPTPSGNGQTPAKTSWSRQDPVYFWGDSAAAGPGGSSDWNNSLQRQLGQHLSVDVVPRAQGGTNSNQALIRAGALLINATPSTGSIPASGPVELDTHGQVIGGWEPNSYTGTYAGIEGVLEQTETGFIFTRTTSGAAVTIDTHHTFTSADAIDGSGTHIFLTAGNDWVSTNPYVPEPDRATHMIANYLRAIDAVPGPIKHVLIGGVKTRQNTAIDSDNHKVVQHVNSELQRLAPQHFVDRQKWLVENSLDILGLEPSPEDLEFMDAGIIPKRAFVDVTHIDYRIVAVEAEELWATALRQRGWA